jgi:hypothetical protein
MHLYIPALLLQALPQLYLLPAQQEQSLHHQAFFLVFYFLLQVFVHEL